MAGFWKQSGVDNKQNFVLGEANETQNRKNRKRGANSEFALGPRKTTNAVNRYGRLQP
jgi:hypothetical protein